MDKTTNLVTMADDEKSSADAEFRDAYRASIHRMIIRANTPRRWFSVVAKDMLDTPELRSALDGLTRGMGRKHWRYTTMAAIAKRAGESIGTVALGVKLLHEHGIIHVQPKHANRQSPLLLTWLFFVSSRVAAEIQYDRDLIKIPVGKFYNHLKPSTRTALADIIPPEGLITSKTAKILEFRREKRHG